MKVLWVVIGGILIGAVVGGGYFLMQSQKASPSVEMAPVENLEPTPTIAPEIVKHQNAAGFSFDHPSSITVRENELDAVSYADLELTSEENPGIMTVKIVDTKLKDLPTWKKTYKAPASSESTEVKLGDLDALRIIEDDNLKLIAIGQSVLYTLELPKSSEYWTEIFDQVVSSWEFELPTSPTAAPARSSGGGAPASSGDIYEEETIE